MAIRHQYTAWERAATFVWGAAEAFLFFIVPDVIVGYVALRRGFRAGLVACLYAAVGAGLGGAAMYAWSARDPNAALMAVEAVPAVSTPMVEAAHAAMTEDGWFVAAMKGPLTSTPFKVYAALAPRHGASMAEFALAALPVRLPRFLFAAAALALIGRAIRGRVSDKLALVLFTGAWVLFYAWFWLSHPG